MSRLSHYIVGAEKRGLDRAAILKGIDIPPAKLMDDDFEASSKHYRLVIRNILDASKAPDIGIDIGFDANLGNLGVLGYAAMSSATIEQSNALFSKYAKLNDHIITYQSYVSGEDWWIDLRSAFPLGDLMHFAVDESVARLVNHMRLLTGKEFSLLRMQVSWSASEYSSRYTEEFGCEVEFGCQIERVLIDAKFMHEKITFSNEEVHQLCSKECEKLLLMSRKRDNIGVRVRKCLAERPGFIPTLEEMAGELSLSSRSLRRSLKEANTTYQKVVDSFRKDMAIQYLVYTDLKPKEVAFLLGYNHVSNFRRAFNVWTGMKLSDFR